MTVCANFKSPNEKSSYNPGDLENKVKVKHDMQRKVLLLGIFGINIKFLSKILNDLWTFVCPLGYNGKIQLWPIKSRSFKQSPQLW